MAHRDGVIDINDTKMGAGGTYSKTFINQTSVPMTPGNCENLICHNGASYNRNWFSETPITCDNCHLNAADTDDYVFRFFTSDNVPRLNQTEWEGSGHGRTGSNYPQSDNPPAAMGCPDCHDPTVPHGDPVIPYKTNGTGDQDVFCLNCHGDAATRGTLFTEVPASANNQNIRTHSQSVFEDVGYGNITTWRIPILKCIDCHDPHGDSNLEMIQRKVWTGGSDSKGRPALPFVGYSTVVFTAFTDTGGYGSTDGTDTYVCEVCHTRTEFHRQGGTAPTLNHYNGIKCSDCHQHSKGWAPLEKCTECHAVARNYVYNTRQIVENDGDGGGDFMKLSRHVNNGTGEEIVTSYDCVVCHAEGDYAKTIAGTGYTDNAKHNNGDFYDTRMVDLRNVDSPDDSWQFNKNATTEQMRSDMDLFCMACHDADGASGITVNSSTDGLDVPAALRATTPFNKLDTLKNGRDGFPTKTRLVDVKSQFYEGTNPPDDTYNGNPSQHAVIGARYSFKDPNWN
ncbi:MAG: hypothetical protein KAJ19_27465, partial [Gammaproteobacteria bacterium]|nr:hypothetical protein [Gammaproteobacteria bacterium]